MSAARSLDATPVAAGASVDALICTYQPGLSLDRCLRALARSDRTGIGTLRAIVVDNASSDGAIDAVRSTQELPVEVIRNAENVGLGRALNRAASRATASYLLILTPDVELDSGALSTAVRLMGRPESADVGISGFRLVDQAGRTTRTCARFPRARHFVAHSFGLDLIAPRVWHGVLMREWDHGSMRVVDHVMYAAALVRRDVFDSLGGFDERFFLFLEDLDLSLRARRAGWRSLYLPDARAIHGGATSRRAYPVTTLFYMLRSRIRYSVKHFAWIEVAAVVAATTLVEPFTRVIFALARGIPGEAIAAVRASLLLWRVLPRILLTDEPDRAVRPAP